MTSRELADKIDQLVVLRMNYREHQHRTVADPVGAIAVLDAIEVTKREIADALKRLDHNKGVYKDQ